MSNPHSTSQQITDHAARTGGSHWFSRIAVVGIHLFFIIAFLFVTGSYLPRVLDLDIDRAGTPVFGLADYGEFMLKYGFLGVLAVLPFDVIAWLLIRKRSDGPHRWKWLMVCTLAIPIIMTATWLLMGPAVRKYYRASVNEPIQLACDVCSRFSMSI